LPRTKKEIDKLEFIQMEIENYEIAIGEFGDWLNKNNLILYPDEFSFLSIYEAHFFVYKSTNYPTDLVYIGNFDLLPPADGYIALDVDTISFQAWENVNINLIKCYNLYNKKDKSIYNVEFSNTRQKNYKINKKIANFVDWHSKQILEKYGDEIGKILNDEPYIAESETYVGSDEEPDEWKK